MNRFQLMTTVILLGFATAACSPADDGGEAEAPAEPVATAEPDAEPAATTEPAAQEAAAAAGEASEAQEISGAILAAVANPARGDEVRARDAGRKPAEVLAFFGVEPGMTVLDVAAGGGYYTEILDGLVGAEGKVIAQNSTGDFYEKFIKARFEPLVARLANTEPYLGSLEDFEVADNSIDAAFIILIFHHMHYNAEQGDVLPEGSKANLARILAALKPGGVLGIIEHAAPDGTSRAASAPLHRVDDATTKADVTGAGFELVAESDILHVATDDRAVYWRDTPHQGKTWRLVHKYIKPAG